MKILKSFALMAAFTFASQTMAQFEASYLIPTEDTDLQPYALAPVNGANLTQQEDGTWVLDYHLPWSIAGTDMIAIEVKGSLDKMRSDDKITRADCSKSASDIPTELTQNLDGEFLPEIVCQISYQHDLVVQLDGRTGDFIDLVMQSFGHDEAMSRLFLRDHFMGEPIGFLGLKAQPSQTIRY
jgi:hypothetical protein